MDEYLLDVLLDKKNNGQKPDRNFSHAAYDVAVKAMNERFTIKVNKDKVTNRLKTLKKMDIGVEVFRRGSGFGWNDITKRIEAPPEVWAELIKHMTRVQEIEFNLGDILPYERPAIFIAKAERRSYDEIKDLDAEIIIAEEILKGMTSFLANSGVSKSVSVTANKVAEQDELKLTLIAQDLDEKVKVKPFGITRAASTLQTLIGHQKSNDQLGYGVQSDNQRTPLHNLMDIKWVGDLPCTRLAPRPRAHPAQRPAPIQHAPMRPHKFFKSRAHAPVKHSARAPNCSARARQKQTVKI
ncbi:hypothetical protein RJ640_015126 [Escallonia rubra]|uniref:Myb/SANT-like domain-containing protein n=1 Tax=Escallonia rubra TaxID=112253 RepID=A0AA88RU47_9ASTE|nr:hypothetical protein RJ640_015126 [Escallonia rubra]